MSTLIAGMLTEVVDAEVDRRREPTEISRMSRVNTAFQRNIPYNEYHSDSLLAGALGVLYEVATRPPNQGGTDQQDHNRPNGGTTSGPGSGGSNSGSDEPSTQPTNGPTPAPVSPPIDSPEPTDQGTTGGSTQGNDGGGTTGNTSPNGEGNNGRVRDTPRELGTLATVILTAASIVGTAGIATGIYALSNPANNRPTVTTPTEGDGGTDHDNGGDITSPEEQQANLLQYLEDVGRHVPPEDRPNLNGANP